MPNFDKTGPEGKGSMTGRGMGPCNPDNPNDNCSCRRRRSLRRRNINSKNN